MLLTALLIFGSFQKGRADCDVPSVTTVSGNQVPSGKICSGDLIFEDNFDELNLKKWQHEVTLGGGGPMRLEKIFLYHGTLSLIGGIPVDQCTNPQWYGCERTGKPDSVLNPIKSARIRTVDSFSFKYGRVDVRAKLPGGDWLWPAIWLLPRYNQYSGWPASGEIDIMESRGNKELKNGDGQNIGTQQVGSTLHFGPNYNYNRYEYAHFEKNNASGYDTNFHTYGMQWNPDNISFYVDDEVIGTDTGLENPWQRNTKMAPFDQEFYIILNLAVGGVNYFPDNADNPGGKPWLNGSPKASTDFWMGRDQWLPTWHLGTDDSHLQVDYVKIWAL
ncbi:hypothetical protein NQ314_016573 [Rhamnusium bicolor]|uniref:GH16 domain-containing protein n=1 Tax=Rhamnusium bicolor TaxID=1586634 RepID=A0AAV8WW37_9CUCU|nr:hypothetical protein NQ314_016573 [Rhamnusium bicolor]